MKFMNFTILHKIPKGSFLSLLLVLAFGKIQGQFVPMINPEVVVGEVGPNLLFNPGFEDGIFNGWGTEGNAFIEDAANPGADVVPVPASGNKHAKAFGNFWGIFNQTRIWQDVPASGGEVIHASVKMLTDNVHLNLAINNTDQIIPDGVDDNWVELHVEFLDANFNFVNAFVAPNFKSTEKFNGNFGLGGAAEDLSLIHI